MTTAETCPGSGSYPRTTRPETTLEGETVNKGLCRECGGWVLMVVVEGVSAASARLATHEAGDGG